MNPSKEWFFNGKKNKNMRSYEREQFIRPVDGTEKNTGQEMYWGLPSFYLTSNIYVGESGQIGLVFVDRNARESILPGDSSKEIVGFDSPIIPAFFRDGLLSGKDDLKRSNSRIFEEFRNNGLRDFFWSIHTMVAVRFYALPREMADVFMQDRYLGPALIRKVCEEDLPVKPLDKDPKVPELFVRKSTQENLQWLFRHTYEVPIFAEIDGDIRSRFPEYGRIDQNGVRTITPFSLGKFLDSLIKSLTGKDTEDYFPIGYATYFSTNLIVYKSITTLLEPLTAEVVQRFDDLCRRPSKFVKINKLLPRK